MTRALRRRGAATLAQSKQPGAVAGLVAGRVPDNDLLSHGQSVLSSARRRFTVLFGMGRGGTGGLWSSGVDQGSGIGYQVSGISNNAARGASGSLIPDT